MKENEPYAFAELVIQGDMKQFAKQYSREYLKQQSDLESIVIGALKVDQLTEAQFLKVSRIMSSKIIVKECYAFNSRKRINIGLTLTSDEISRLLIDRSYSTIELALRKQRISKEAILLLVKPYEGQNDKKIRIRISQQAQLLISK